MTDARESDPTGATKVQASHSSAAAGTSATGALPLCVDLDGTLVRTDTLHEQLVRAAARSPWSVLLWPVWLLRGRAAFKQRIAREGAVDPSLLPYRDDLVEYLRQQREAGRPIVLCTAADRTQAEAVARHLGLFDDVLASDGRRNLKGAEKADVLVARFGERGYVYAGDSAADIAVWAHAGAAIPAGASGGVRRRLAAAGAPVEAAFASGRGGIAVLPKALRIYQWVKNLLVFAPLALAHNFESAAVLATVAMFAAFCATASGIYVVNDLLDLDSDRAHPRKRARPFASGDLPLAFGILGPALAVVGLVVAAAVSPASLAVLAAYVVLTTAYSAKLKRFPLVDVFLLAALYTIRLYAGGVASGSPVSLWLLGFSSFLFLSLAFVKRYGELTGAAREGRARNSGRGYMEADAPMLQALGVASAFSASLVLSMYVDTNVAREFYALPALLWLVVPLHLFWQCRIWLAAGRGHMSDDPIVFAARDRVSWLVAGLTVASFVGARRGVPL